MPYFQIPSIVIDWYVFVWQVFLFDLIGSMRIIAQFDWFYENHSSIFICHANQWLAEIQLAFFFCVFVFLFRIITWRLFICSCTRGGGLWTTTLKPRYGNTSWFFKPWPIGRQCFRFDKIHTDHLFALYEMLKNHSWFFKQNYDCSIGKVYLRVYCR